MMITSITRKSSSVFLAIVLVVGVITVSSPPSFIIEAEAQSAYAMYNYKEPKVSIEKLKCNNDIFEIDVTNSQLASQVQNEIQKLLAQEEAADQREKNFFDERISLLCTNIDDEIKLPVSDKVQSLEVQSSEVQPKKNMRSPIAKQLEPVAVGCEECLEKLSPKLQTQFITSIANLANPILKMDDVTLDFTGITTTSAIVDVCPIIDAAVKANDPISMSEIITEVNDLLPDLDAEGQGLVAEVLVCLLKAKLLELDTGITVS